jgi:chloramphenicol-sensitive protein RarD
VTTSPEAPAGPTAREAARASAAGGVAFAAAAYTLWGVFAAYYQLLAEVPAVEVIAHRVIWSVPLVGAVLVIGGHVGSMLFALRSGRVMATLLLTSLLIALNWGVFVWAVLANRLLEVSFGYFLTPLASIGFGIVLLGERLRRDQWVAVALAAAAVISHGIGLGVLPWLPLLLAGTFAFYGYLRKTVNAGAGEGLFIELALLLPLSLGYLAWLGARGDLHFLATPMTPLWLVLTGPVTALPLFLFAAAARRLRLATVGLMQYIAPSIHFVLALTVFGQDPGPGEIAAFTLIWIAIVLYSRDALRGGGRAA